MNKLLVATFDTEADAHWGLNALRRLHAAGDITLFATAALARDATGLVGVKQSMGSGPVGTATGLAVGSLIGLLGGPVGVAIGALTGTVAGAVRDFWAAGGQVMRRTRTEVAEAQFDHAIAVFKSEIKELEDEASHASGAAKTKLEAKIAAAKASLESAVKVRIEDRMKRVESAHLARSAKLSQAWSLTKEAFTG